MPRRRSHSSSSRLFDKDDNPIDLTDAFAPVRGPQSVDYDKEDDPLGLTNAFGAIPPKDAVDHHWANGSKWSDFDWDAESGTSEEEADSSFDGGNVADEVEEFDEIELVEGEGDDKAPAREQKEATSKAGSKQKGSKHGRHAAPEKELTPRMKKSKRTRKVLIVLLVLLLIVVGALGYFAFKTISNSQHEAAQQTQDTTTESSSASSIEQTNDAKESLTRLADVPNLATLLGMTQDEAIASIGHGALVTSNREVSEEGNPIKTSLNIALTEESADSKTGTPTVYLGLGEDGRVRQAGYSASASALGFGSHSFATAVREDHVVEGTLAKAGVNIPAGSAVLPEDIMAYTTYASDGKTAKSERSSFEGDVEVNGIPCTWSAVLSYDYTTANVTGNLNDTVRIIYVYITMR